MPEVKPLKSLLFGCLPSHNSCRGWLASCGVSCIFIQLYSVFVFSQTFVLAETTAVCVPHGDPPL